MSFDRFHRPGTLVRLSPGFDNDIPLWLNDRSDDMSEAGGGLLRSSELLLVVAISIRYAFVVSSKAIGYVSHAHLEAI